MTTKYHGVKTEADLDITPPGAGLRHTLKSWVEQDAVARGRWRVCIRIAWLSIGDWGVL